MGWSHCGKRGQSRPVKERLQRVFEKIGAFSGAKAFKRIDFGLAILVTVIALVVYAYIETSGRNAAGLRFIENIEARSLDARFNFRGERPHDENIVIVGLEETTLQRVGAFPIPRNAYAKMVDQLAKDGARLVVFDFNFPLPEKNSAVEALKKLEANIEGQASPAVMQKISEIEASSDNDKILADSLEQAGNVVLGHIFLDSERAKSVDASVAQQYFDVLDKHPFPGRMVPLGGVAPFQVWERVTADAAEYSYLNASGVYANLGILAQAARSSGFFNEMPDPDGTFRRSPLLMRYKRGDDDQFYPSLDLEAVRQYENIKDESIAVDIAENGIDHIEFGPYNLRPGHDGTVMVNYAGHYKTYKHYPMIDVVEGRFSPGSFKDKLVVF